MEGYQIIRISCRRKKYIRRSGYLPAVGRSGDRVIRRSGYQVEEKAYQGIRISVGGLSEDQGISHTLLGFDSIMLA